MNPQSMPPQSPGLNLADIYYVLFRHKWKILFFSAAGIAGAVAMHRLEPALYQSEAKLTVRYIVSEPKTRAVSNEPQTIVPDRTGGMIMDGEKEILSSVDLATAVANEVGPEKILAKVGGGKDLNTAGAVVKGGLTVYVAPASSVLHIAFKHPDRQIVQEVLAELVKQYLKKHSEIHNATGMQVDALDRETNQYRTWLKETEDDLRKALSVAGIISFDDAKATCSNQMAAIRREIGNYKTELAGAQGTLDAIKKQLPAGAGATALEAEAPIPTEVIEAFADAMSRVNIWKNKVSEASSVYTAENPRFKEMKAQLADAESARNKILEQYPKLLRANPATSGQSSSDSMTTDALTASMQVTNYQSRIDELNRQYEDLRLEAAKLDKMEGGIMELRRKKALYEASYTSAAGAWDISRINDRLGNGRVSNISEIQKPSPPFQDSVSNKKLGMSVGGGILAGLAWAFLIELYLDRSVRRPIDLERTLRAPLFLSIPRIKMNGSARALKTNGKLLSLPPGKSDPLATAHGPTANGSANGKLAETTPHDPLHPFHETLRDRLIGFFESKNLHHKPKLVAVTGLGGDAGVTTTAAGLARSLSETGEGNVLLVDMTVSKGAAQQFVKGKPACGLDEILTSRDQAQVHENLYVVTESNSNSDRISRNLPQRFTTLIPKLKASDFDYIIFDMPPVSQLSITPRLAGFMDMVLLVIESEKTDRDNVQKAAALLAEAKVHVGVVLNKTRNYVPALLHQEFLNSC